MKTYTVLIPAEKGNSGVVPVDVHTEMGQFKMEFIRGETKTGVPEPVVNVLKESYPEGTYIPEGGPPPEDEPVPEEGEGEKAKSD